VSTPAAPLLYNESVKSNAHRWRGSFIGSGLLVLVAGVLIALTVSSARDGSALRQAAQATLVPTIFIPGMPAFCFPPEGTPPHIAELTPQPSPSAQPAAPLFSLAWFHKPPNDGSTPADLASEHRYIHLTGPSDARYRDRVWDAGYNGHIYTYVTAYAVEGPGPYRDASARCNADYQPFDNNLAWGRGDFCRYIHPNESWFLHNSDGERIYEDYFDNGRYTYLMNPADPGWRDYSYERLERIKREWGYSGIWLDNVDLDLDRATRGGENSDGSAQEFSNNSDFRAAMAGWLKGLRERLGDYPVWANLVGGRLEANSWDQYEPYLDGAMDESYAVRWLDGWRSPGEWLAQAERAERWLSREKGLVLVGQGEQEDERRMRFTLASYMLVANDHAHFRYTRFDQYYFGLWLYPEFETARELGPATGPRQRIAENVYRRPFACGYVEVDVAAHEGRLVIEKTPTPVPPGPYVGPAVP
jgi:hypothetical protein